MIWTVKHDKLGSLPFNTKQFFHIAWKTPTDLAHQLGTALEHRSGRGPFPPKPRRGAPDDLNRGRT